jgi:uncharacterized membrane protein YphA (DoxX/SURF4 family)
MVRHDAALERSVAIFLTRTTLGFVYFFAGVNKLTEVGVVEFGRRAAALPDLAGIVPQAILMAVGSLTPLVELVLGALVLFGLWTRPALRCLAALIILITLAYGVHGLLHPMGATAMNIAVVNFYILPRAALLIVTLFLPAEDDLLSVDALRDGRFRRFRIRRA